MPEFDELGYNYKLSDIAAAMMLVQLDRLPDLIKARQTVAEGYAERLAGCELITLPVTAPDRVHVWQSYVLTLDAAVNRGAVALALRTAGVQCTFGTYASHVQPLYGPSPDLPGLGRLFDRATWPSRCTPT